MTPDTRLYLGLVVYAVIIVVLFLAAYNGPVLRDGPPRFPHDPPTVLLP